MSHRTIIWMIAVALLSSGCVNIQQNAGFQEVQEGIDSRSGLQVTWYQDEASHEAFQAEIETMLVDSLTLEEAIQIGLLNNQNLQAEYELLGVAYADLVQAGLFRNPSFSTHIGYPVEEDHDPDLAFGLSFNFLDFFQIPLKKKIAASMLREVQLELTSRVLVHTNEVVRAFYEVQAAEQTFQMLGQVALAAEASFETARLLQEAGNARLVDRHNGQAFYEETRIELAAAALAVSTAREHLNRLLGLWGDQVSWQIADRLPLLEDSSTDVTQIEKSAVSSSLDLELAQARLETFGHQAGLVNATALLPNLELGIDAEREGAWEVGPEIGFPIPLFDQGQAKKAASVAEIRRQQAQYYALGVEIRSEARLLGQQLMTAYQTARHYRDVILPLRVQISSESQMLFNAMQIGVFQLIEARRQEITAGKKYIEALAQYWLIRTNYDTLLQGKLPGPMKATNIESKPAMPAPSDGGH